MSSHGLIFHNATGMWADAFVHPEWEQIVGFWFSLDVNVPFDQIKSNHDNMILWCTDLFGPQHSKTNKDGDWGINDSVGTIYFKDPAHATLFKLRWS